MKELSGGQRQKLAIVLALIGNPEIIVLDEISTGLDPKARVQIWHKIKELNNNGKTILLTTHFMEEAEQLCDRVCLLVDGKIKASGTLDEMIAESGLQIKITAYASKAELGKINHSNIPVGVKVEILDEYAELLVDKASNISHAMAWICERIQINDMDLYKPKLEDVFLKLTGTSLEVKNESVQ